MYIKFKLEFILCNEFLIERNELFPWDNVHQDNLSLYRLSVVHSKMTKLGQLNSIIIPLTLYHIHHRYEPLVDFPVDAKWREQLTRCYSWTVVDTVNMNMLMVVVFLEDGFVCDTVVSLDMSTFFYIQGIWKRPVECVWPCEMPLLLVLLISYYNIQHIPWFDGCRHSVGINRKDFQTMDVHHCKNSIIFEKFREYFKLKKFNNKKCHEKIRKKIFPTYHWSHSSR